MHAWSINTVRRGMHEGLCMVRSFYIREGNKQR
jgi:hypothetical protein